MAPRTNNEFGIADKLNSERKFIVSNSLEKAEWNNSILIRGKVVEEIRKLKQQPGGDIRLVGSAIPTRSLMQTDLVDEYWLLVHPIVRGRGRRLFKEGMEPLSLKLVETKSFSSGVVLLHYRPVME